MAEANGTWVSESLGLRDCPQGSAMGSWTPTPLPPLGAWEVAEEYAGTKPITERAVGDTGTRARLGSTTPSGPSTLARSPAIKLSFRNGGKRRRPFSTGATLSHGHRELIPGLNGGVAFVRRQEPSPLPAHADLPVPGACK